MTQVNTKLCEFSSTNNNDLISTPIAPPATSAESCDINTALLNLVMKDQFSGTPNEDAASHLNTFVELSLGRVGAIQTVFNPIPRRHLGPSPSEWAIGCPSHTTQKPSGVWSSDPEAFQNVIVCDAAHTKFFRTCGIDD